MLNAEFYDSTQSLSGGFFRAMTAVRRPTTDEPTATPPPLLQVQPGMAESPGWFLVQAAEFEPEPLTVTGLRRRDIYASPRIVQAILEMMAAEKWFDRLGEGYHLTETGRAFIQERQSRRDQALAALDPLIEVDLAELDGLLSRVVNGCLASDDPPGNWCLAHSRRRGPVADAALSVKLFQYLADLNAFRDDAHMAAWRPHGVLGYTWEAFSLVGTGRASSAATLYDRLAYRGYSRHDYGHALRTLASWDWLETISESTFQVTDQGREILREVESLTDHYFYAPWRATLDEDEIAAVNDLVVQLRQELQVLAG